MKTRTSIIAILTGILTSVSVSAFATHDSIVTHGKNIESKVILQLDSLKPIEMEEEQAVQDIDFSQRQSDPVQLRPRLYIYGQHLSEPSEEVSEE